MTKCRQNIKKPGNRFTTWIMTALTVFIFFGGTALQGEQIIKVAENILLPELYVFFSRFHPNSLVMAKSSFTLHFNRKIYYNDFVLLRTKLNILHLRI